MFLKKILFFTVLNFLFLSNLHATFLEIDVINYSSYTLSIKDISLRKGTVVKKEFYDNNLDLINNEIILPQTKAIIFVEHLEEEFTEVTMQDLPQKFWGIFSKDSYSKLTDFENYREHIRRGPENSLLITLIKNIPNSETIISEVNSIGWFSCLYKFNIQSSLKYNYFALEDNFKKLVNFEIQSIPLKKYFLLNTEEKQTELGARISIRDYDIPPRNIIN